jgi:hypothetical protein|tara:strand:+ start:643 stop:1377 length:735 start_codon:yes stop_codon:yes gene_type:complete
MISKQIIQSVIDKYYLGVNESVKWVINDKHLSIDFMTPTKDVIGSVECDNFELENTKLAIYDTKKLQSLIGICSGDLLLELQKQKEIVIKLNISDMHFNLQYALSDPLLIGKVGNVNIPDWVVEIDLTLEDLTYLLKAKGALKDIDNMLVTTTTNLDGEPVCEFIFGDESGHNNKITYQLAGRVDEGNIKLPFNSDTFKMILQANKGMESGKLTISSMGLMGLEFKDQSITSKYYMVRKSDTSF